MSTRRDPIRVVQQFALEGGIDVVELHGLGGRTRMNILRNLTPRAAGLAVRDSRTFLGAEFIAGESGDLERPCPRCGAVGSAEDVFGFRCMRGRRVRQSWCRGCRAKRTRT
jgi:hypothetical protein